MLYVTFKHISVKKVILNRTMHYRNIHLRRQEKPAVNIFIENYAGGFIQQKVSINKWQINLERENIIVN